MACPSCQSSNQAEFPAEINIHLPATNRKTEMTSGKRRMKSI